MTATPPTRGTALRSALLVTGSDTVCPRERGRREPQGRCPDEDPASLGPLGHGDISSGLQFQASNLWSPRGSRHGADIAGNGSSGIRERRPSETVLAGHAGTGGRRLVSCSVVNLRVRARASLRLHITVTPTKVRAMPTTARGGLKAKARSSTVSGVERLIREGDFAADQAERAGHLRQLGGGGWSAGPASARPGRRTCRVRWCRGCVRGRWQMRHR